MTTQSDPDRKPQDAKALREARVAAALRENLRRRKEQARARAAEGHGAAPGESAGGGSAEQLAETGDTDAAGMPQQVPHQG